MSEKILSIFIDESGDFGSYKVHAPYYLISIVIHNQRIDISENIKVFDSHLLNLGYQNHAIHTGPLIRQPVDYKLFQIADLICTMELLAQKAECNSFTRSEIDFFGSIRDFKKNYLKHIKKKILS